MFAEFYRSNRDFVFIAIIWFLAGRFVSQVTSAFVLLSLLLFIIRDRSPFILFGFFLLLYFSDSYVEQFSFAKPTKPFYLIGIGVAFFLGRCELKQGSRFFAIFIPFLALAFLVIGKSEIPSMAAQKTLSYLLFILIIPNLTISLYKRYGPNILRQFIVLLTLLLLIALLLKFSGSNIVGRDRFRGFLGNPNAIGLNCTTFFILFVVVKQYFPNLFIRREVLFIYIVILTSCFFSGSRNAIFSISIFILLARFFTLSPFFGMIIMLLAGMSYQLVMDNLHFIVQQLGLSSFLRESTLDNASGRNVAWRFGWEEIQKNFFLGKGFGHEEYIYFHDGNQQMLNLMGSEGAAHNSFISIWLSTGLFGLVLFMYAILSKFITAAKNTFIALPILAMILFSAFFESWLIGSLNPYSILLMMSLTIMTAHEFNQEKPKGSFSLL